MGGELVSTRDRLDWNFLDPTRKVGLKKPSNPTNPYTHYSNFLKKNLRVLEYIIIPKYSKCHMIEFQKEKKKKIPYASIFGRFSICFQIIMK